jgi:hypothetical protein
MIVCNTDMVNALSEGTSDDGGVSPGAALADASRCLGAMVTRLGTTNQAGLKRTLKKSASPYYA